MTKSSANDRQVGGEHYRAPIQHWDYVLANNLDYMQGQITKYVARWKDKNGLEDLLKAQHFLEKYIEWVKDSIPVNETPAHGDYHNFQYEGAMTGGYGLYRCLKCGWVGKCISSTEAANEHGECAGDAYVAQ